MADSIPDKHGPYNFTSVIYSAPGLNYTDPQQQQYKIFETATAGYQTKYIDTSAFSSLSRSFIWPFDIYNTPINGLARIPDGEGPFPLVLFAHGNHSPAENSTPGYIYLCELLASHGFIAASIDVNFLNGWNFGENDGRGIIHLEHIKQFTQWNQQAGHALAGKVDVDNIMIVGHSRGAEGVGHASYFNRLDSVQPETFSPVIALDGSNGLGPYHFNLKAVAAIAPTDGQYVAVTGPVKIADNYFLIHGSRDNDVWPFPGQKIYDRAYQQASQTVADPENTIGPFKSLLWIHGANHNFFNSVWQQESSNTITREQQQQILSVYLTALALLTLKKQKSYRALLMNHKYAYQQGWIPASQKLVSQFYDYNSFSIQNNENQSNLPVLNNTVSGSVETVGINYQLLNMDLGANKHLYQETRGLRIDWQQPDSAYIVNLDPNSLASNEYSHLSFRVGQSFEANNTDGVDQDFNIELTDGEKSTTIKASEVTDLIFPDAVNAQWGREPRTVMQSVFIPIEGLKNEALELEDINQIKLNFNLTNSGTVYMDDLTLISDEQSKGENTHDE